ncbi:hypothetical protein CEXT_289531 [Caerostris extrusa]|uniref:Uncharacterized protein n=1 Tax=Caerostris extrusa TaxID=172846 RepID=A0AAV4P5G5_CAEEX|nr:hypothetical protein CEXT_289531 [Caerostris extrusa]
MKGIDMRQFRFYKVPESLMPQTEEEVAEFLEKGLIELSWVEIAYHWNTFRIKMIPILKCGDYTELKAHNELSPSQFKIQDNSGIINYLKIFFEGNSTRKRASREFTSFLSQKGQINMMPQCHLVYF